MYDVQYLLYINVAAITYVVSYKCVGHIFKSLCEACMLGIHAQAISSFR